MNWPMESPVTSHTTGYFCAQCGNNNVVRQPGKRKNVGKCLNCYAEIAIWGTGRKISVSGADHREVLAVVKGISESDAKITASKKFNNPWMAGSFYLCAGIVVIAVLLVAARLVPGWSLPVVIAAAILLLSVIGAFQLRNDDRLSERNFGKLMSLALLRLPTLLRQDRSLDEK